MIPPLGTSTIVTRLGGDEFVVLAAGAGRAETEERLVHLYDSLTRDSLLRGGTPGERTAYTAAVVELDPAEPLDAIIARADRILVQRKSSRRAERRLVLRPTFRLTTSQPRSLLSMARLNVAKSRLRFST
jgi:GGDEF domain-containing protein